MRIRRSACGALVVTCSVAASAAALAAETKRTAEAPYETPGGVAGVIAGDTVINGESYGGATFETRRSERAVSVSLADGTGMPAAGELAQDVDGDGVLEQPFASFCGRTSEPVPITPGRPLRVHVQAGACGGGVSAPTTGTVTVTFIDGEQPPADTAATNTRSPDATPAPAPEPTPEPVVERSEPAPAVATLATRRLALRGRFAVVALRCPGPGPCSGRAAFAGAPSRPFSLAPGQSARLRLRVGPRRARPILQVIQSGTTSSYRVSLRRSRR